MSKAKDTRKCIIRIDGGYWAGDDRPPVKKFDDPAVIRLDSVEEAERSVEIIESTWAPDQPGIRPPVVNVVPINDKDGLEDRTFHGTSSVERAESWTPGHVPHMTRWECLEFLEWIDKDSDFRPYHKEYTLPRLRTAVRQMMRECGIVDTETEPATADECRTIVGKWLGRLGRGFHPETPAADYENTETGERTFNYTERAEYRADMARLYHRDSVVDPCAVAIELLEKLEATEAKP